MSDIKALAKKALELSEKATAGEWTSEYPGDDKEEFCIGVKIATIGRNQSIYACPAGGSNPHNDKLFIAEARTLLPEIATAYLALAEKVERLEAAVDLAMSELFDCAGYEHAKAVSEKVEQMRKDKPKGGE